MTPEQRAALTELRAAWGGSYYITCTPGGLWRAKPLSARDTVLVADSAAELLGMIQRDYARWRPQSSSGP